MPYRLRCLVIGCVLLPINFGLLGCKSNASAGLSERRPEDFDASPIDVARFLKDPAIQQRVLGMSFSEVARRLGSAQLEVDMHFSFSRDTQEIDQRDRFVLRQDSQGSFYLLSDTNKASLEVYSVNDEIYVRHDKGQLRHKQRQQLDTGAWVDLAWSSQRDALELFASRLTFPPGQNGRPQNFAGRQATVFELGLAETATVTLPAKHPRDGLASAPPSRFRELANPLALNGTLVVDNSTGAILQLDLKGRVEVADRDLRPTQLAVRYTSKLASIGKVAVIKPPKSRPEFQRKRPPADVLGFFRDHLPPSLGDSAP